MTNVGDKVPAPLEFERVENSIFAGLRQEWVAGEDGLGVSFALTAGAGLGNPYMTLRVELPNGKVIYEVADVRSMVTTMVSRIITEYRDAEDHIEVKGTGCPAGSQCTGAEFPGHPAHEVRP
jgi:hypothetical protein